jgi:D-alanyl-D-alanine carboxypeptidase/D-alanyl-D-alanine-endopeptidase (penicillin-binding protein 4)
MIDSLLADLAPPGATVTALAVDSEGAVLAKRNPDRVAAPASNVKLITAAAALESLSPDFQAATTVQAAGRIEDRVLDGDIHLIGGGAPDFDRAALRSLARAVEDQVDTVTGDLVLDTTLFEGPRYGPGRAWEDAQFAYGAPTTALSLDKNVASVRVAVDAAGDVEIDVEPATSVINIDVSELVTEKDTPDGTADADGSRVTTDNGSTVRAESSDGSISVQGFLSRGEVCETLVPIRQPIEHTMRVAREALVDCGVVVKGGSIVKSEPESTLPDEGLTDLGTVRSAPLGELVRTMNVDSDNVIADTLARVVAADTTGTGSWSEWADLVRSRLDTLGVRSGHITDGSGLSRYNRLSARAMVTVLRHVAETPWATTFFKSLPEPGEGTLSERLHGLPVRAKTGSLTDARALSGRLLRNGEPIYFSLLVDGITRNATAVRERQDDVVRALAGCDSSPVHTS